MPNKKKKYSARFPPARIKKIMQKDEEVGKVAAAVPVIISRSLELFIESLIKKTNDLVILKNAKTLTPQHIKQTVLQDKEFKFLSELVSSIPDIQPNEDDNQQETSASLPRQSQPTSSTFIPSHSTSNLPSPNFGGRSGASGVSAKVSTGKPRGRPKKMKIADELPFKSKRSKKMKMDNEWPKASEDSSGDSDNDYDKTTQSPMTSPSSLAATQQQQQLLSASQLPNSNNVLTSSSSLSLPTNHVAFHTPALTANQSTTQHPINQSLASYQLPSQLSTNEIVASEPQQPILQQISAALSSLQNPTSSSEIMNSVLSLNSLDDDLHRQMKEQLLQQHTLLLQHHQQLLLAQQQQLQQQLQHQKHLEKLQLEQLIQSITPLNDTNILVPSLPFTPTNTTLTTMATTTTTVTAANLGIEATSQTLNDGVLDLSKSSTSLINKNIITSVKSPDGIQLISALFPNHHHLISNVPESPNRTLPQGSYMLNIPKVNMPQSLNIQLIQQQQQQQNNDNSLAQKQMLRNIDSNIGRVGNTAHQHIPDQWAVADQPPLSLPDFPTDGNQSFSHNVISEDRADGGADNNKTVENN